MVDAQIRPIMMEHPLRRTNFNADSIAMEDDDADQETPADEAPRSGILKRIRNEFRIEFFVALVFFLLGFGLTAKVIVGVIGACLRFAVPDVITAGLVLRHDPDRGHGIAVALLFLAMGMCRSAVVAFCAVMGFAMIGNLFDLVPGPALLASVITCMIIVYVFLLLIFPSTFLAFLVAKYSDIKLYFSHELTRVRRTGKGDASMQNVPNSLYMIAIGSGISLSIVICSTLFVYALFPNVQAGPEVLVVILAIFAAPPIWIKVFTSQVSPK